MSHRAQVDERVDRGRRGVTLLELLIALALVSVLSGIALPSMWGVVERISVRGAAGDVAESFETARALAIARGARASVAIDTIAEVVTLVVGPDTVMRRDVRREHGARLRASRTSASYTPLGLALGVSNLTVVATRGSAADTVTVSRLGRVRW